MNSEIDESLFDTAIKLGGYSTKREAVNAALEEFVSRRCQLRVLEYAGAFDFDPGYDYKAERKRR